MQVYISNTLIFLVLLLAFVTAMLLSSLVMLYRFYKGPDKEKWISDVKVESGYSDSLGCSDEGSKMTKKIRIEKFHNRDDISFYWYSTERVPQSTFLSNESLMRTYKFMPHKTSTVDENSVEQYSADLYSGFNSGFKDSVCI